MTRARIVVLAALCFALAACDNAHSVLAPHGAGARSIAVLTWVLLAIVAAVLAVVVAATALAIRGSDRFRRRLGQRTTIVAGGIVFPAVVLSVLLVYGLVLMRADAAGPQAAPQIAVVGEQWWWRVRYRLPDGREIESANEIRLPVGRDVVLALTSPDVIHSLWIPSLAGKVDLIPGRTTTLTLRAERAGVYRGACAEYCGGPHALMALHAVALAPEDFDRWLDARRSPSRALGASEARGQSLFEAAGCGACHAIDGTAARGTIGPDLSDIGSRRTVGAGLLPLSRENLARFIAHGQRLKPGNKMPPFAIFTDSELADLSAYLAALK